MEWDASAYYSDGKEVPRNREDCIMVAGKREKPKMMLAPGDNLALAQPVPVTDAKIDQLPAGEYKLIFLLRYSIRPEAGIFERQIQESTTFFIEKPLGEDADWLKYVGETKKALFKDNPRKIALSLTLGWGDVIECGFCPHGFLDMRSQLLQKYPTSTYAAYAACPPNQWTSNTDPERILKAIETGTYLSNGSVPDDTGKSKDGWLYQNRSENPGLLSPGMNDRP